MKSSSVGWAVAVLALAAALTWGAVLEYREVTEPVPVPAADVVNDAIQQLQQRALNARQVDWLEARRIALDRARSGRHRDLDAALSDLVRRLDDGHSFYLPARAAQGLTAPDKAPAANSMAEPMPSIQGVRRVAVNGYAVLDPEAGREAATQLRQLVNAARQGQACGLLLDLTRNGGGNMYPMLLGLLPLLPEGALLQFEDGQGQRSVLRQVGGGIWLGETQVEALLPGEATASMRVPGPVAVLTGPHTGSAGEMVALAFKALPNARSFGQATAGLTSANTVLPLKHGGLIAVTTSVAADRLGQIYRGRIEPDERFDDMQAAAHSAATWVNQECGRNR